jgi:hypothetical protein
MDKEKKQMTPKPVHSSAIKIKDLGDTDSSNYTKAKELIKKKIIRKCRSLRTNKKLFEGKEKESIFENSPKERENNTSDWRLGLCKNIFHKV